MAYNTAFDPESNYTMDRVVSFSRHMLKGGTAFTTATTPQLADVEGFIDAAVADVQMCLVAAGYSTAQPVGTVGTPAATWLSNGVVWGALVDTEASRPTIGNTAPEGNERFRLFQKRYEAFKEALKGATLEQMGGTRDRNLSDGMKWTGSSWDEQDGILEDTDRKDPLFPRGFLDPDSREVVDTEGV